MPIDITPPALLSKMWGTPTNVALQKLADEAQTADEVEVIAEAVADAKFADVSVDLTDATMTATAETPTSDFAQHLNSTIAVGADPLATFRGKLASNPAAVKIALVGDSTMDEGAAAPAMYARLRKLHTAAGRGLAGMTEANILDRGHNGMSLAMWRETPAHLAQLASDDLDLIVASWLINDVRLGVTDEAAALLLLEAFVDDIRSVYSPDVPIVLLCPMAFLTVNSGGSDYVQGPPGTVNPAGAAQAYSTLLRNVYTAMQSRFAGVIVLDIQGDLTGTTSRPTAVTMGDQIHPSSSSYDTAAGIPVGGGMVARADYLVEKIGLPGFGSRPIGFRQVVDVLVTGGGSNYFDLNADVPGGFVPDAGVLPFAQFPISGDDFVFFDGRADPVSLSDATIIRPYGDGIRFLKTGDWSAYAGRKGSVAANHAGPTTGDRRVVAVDLPSIAAGATVSASVTVTGVRPGDEGTANAVIGTPATGFSGAGLLLLGCFVSNWDTVKVVVQNPTGSAVDRPSENWAFFFIR